MQTLEKDDIDEIFELLHQILDKLNSPTKEAELPSYSFSEVISLVQAELGEDDLFADEIDHNWLNNYLIDNGHAILRPSSGGRDFIVPSVKGIREGILENRKFTNNAGFQIDQTRYTFKGVELLLDDLLREDDFEDDEV